MTSLNIELHFRVKFHILGINGNNYQSWSLNIELHFQDESVVESLKEDEKETDKDKKNLKPKLLLLRQI